MFLTSNIKLQIFHVLVSLSFFIISFSIQAYDYEINKNNIVTFECPEDCDPLATVESLIKLNGNVNYVIRYDATYNGHIIYSKIVEASSLNFSEPVDSISGGDSPLDCSYDRDWTCNDWENDALWGNHAMAVKAEINRHIWEITLTQADIDAMRNIEAWLTNFLIGVGTSGPIAAYILKFGIDKFMNLVAVSAFSATLSQMIKVKLFRGKVGDVLVIRGASADLYSPENFANLPSNRGGGVYECRTVYTNSGAGDRATIVCYARNAE